MAKKTKSTKKSAPPKKEKVLKRLGTNIPKAEVDEEDSVGNGSSKDWTGKKIVKVTIVHCKS